MSSLHLKKDDDARAEAEADALADGVRGLRAEIGKAIVGQTDVVEQLLIGLLAHGHVLLEGVPGLAKTLLASTAARALGLPFRRVQFTPDMMPSDLTGSDVLQTDPETGHRQFVFLPGPIFAHVVLADEINRTPPKTQSALLEAMQERHVSAGGRTYPLPEPFFVLATQNPIEQEGAYPLPEAQLDRFLLNVRVLYPSADDELEVLRRTTGDETPAIRQTMTIEEMLAAQKLTRRLPMAEYAMRYARDLVRASRPGEPEAIAFARQHIAWGAGPRAGQALILAAKARALLHGRWHAGVEDIRAAAAPVLRHRILVTYRAEAEGVSADQIVARLLEDVPAPGLTKRG